MEVGNIMTQSVRTISALATIQEAAEAMAEHGLGALPVCLDGRLVGIVTDRDLLVRCIAEGHSASQVAVEKAMTTKPFVLSPRDSLERAVELFEQHHVRRLPVVEYDSVIGILSVDDVARRIGAPEVVGAIARGVAYGAGK